MSELYRSPMAPIASSQPVPTALSLTQPVLIAPFLPCGTNYFGIQPAGVHDARAEGTRRNASWNHPVAIAPLLEGSTSLHRYAATPLPWLHCLTR